MFNPISFTPHRLIYKNPEGRPCPREVKKSLAAGEDVLAANAKLLDLAKKTITQNPLPERREFPGDTHAPNKKPNVDPNTIDANMALLMGTPETQGRPEHLMDHEEQWLMRDVNALASKYFIHIDFNEYLQRTSSSDLKEAIQFLIEYPHDLHYARIKDKQGEILVIRKRNSVFSAAPNNPAIPNDFEVKLRIPESIEPHPTESVDFMSNAYITHINGVDILQKGAPNLNDAESQQEWANLHTQYFNEVAKRVEGIIREDIHRPATERKTNTQIIKEAIDGLDRNLLEHHLQATKQFPERVAELMQLWQKMGILNAQNLPEGVEWLTQKVKESPESVPSEIMVTPVPANQGKKLYWIWDIASPEALGLVINEFGLPMQMNENGKWAEALDGSYFNENLYELHGKLEQELNRATEQQIRDLAKHIAEQMPAIEEKDALNDPEQSKEDLTKLILEITPKNQLKAIIEHLDFIKNLEMF